MNLTPTAAYGIIAAMAAVVIAYLIGFSAGRNQGRDEGYSDGRKEGSKEGSARGYAVGFDRGRRHNGEDGDGDAAPRPTMIWALLGLILAGIVLFVLSQTPRGPIERPPEPSIELNDGVLLPPLDEPGF